MSNSQLKKLKSAIKTGTEVTLNLWSNLIINSNDETNFPHKLLLTDKQVLNISKAFANGSSANKNFSKTLLSKIIQLGGALHGIPSLWNILWSVAKRGIYLPWDLWKKIDKQIDSFDKEYITGLEITLISNEIKDIMKVIKSLQNSIKRNYCKNSYSHFS